MRHSPGAEGEGSPRRTVRPAELRGPRGQLCVLVARRRAHLRGADANAPRAVRPHHGTDTRVHGARVQHARGEAACPRAGVGVRGREDGGAGRVTAAPRVRAASPLRSALPRPGDSGPESRWAPGTSGGGARGEGVTLASAQLRPDKLEVRPDSFFPLLCKAGPSNVMRTCSWLCPLL